MDSSSDSLAVNHYGGRAIIRRMWPLVRPYWRRLTLAVGLIMAVGVIMSTIPLFSKYLIDVALPRQDMARVLEVCLAFLCLQFARMGLWFVAQRMLLHVRENVVYAMRTQGFRHLQRLCMRFHGRYPSGFLHDRVFERSICSIGSFLALVFSNLTVYASGLVFSLAGCFYLSRQMTFIVLVSACAYVVVSQVMSPRIRAKSLDAAEAHSRIHGYILDKLRGTKTIQAFAVEDRVEQDFTERIEPVKRKWIGAQLQIMKLGFVTEGIGYFITASMFVVGSWAIFKWHMPVGSLVAFIGYQGQLISFIAQLANVYGQFALAQTGFDQFYSVLDTHSSVVERPGAVMPERIEGRLMLDAVTFGYGERPVVKDLTVRVDYGETVALVGRSGSGKTTLTNLLMRFYDPDQGRVLLDDIDVRELPLREYRAQFGMVLQEPFMFDDTVAANLRLARPTASDAEIEEVLRRSRSWEFVQEFPEKTAYRVGEGGCRLSGGQRQRLAIARCMLLKPRFVILDEATSALDSETEVMVQQALDEIFRGRTAFIIAHRLSTIRRANRILVLDHGELVEEGTYDALLQRQGLFHHLHSIATSSSLHDLKLKDAGFA